MFDELGSFTRSYGFLIDLLSIRLRIFQLTNLPDDLDQVRVVITKVMTMIRQVRVEDWIVRRELVQVLFHVIENASSAAEAIMEALPPIDTIDDIELREEMDAVNALIQVSAGLSTSDTENPLGRLLKRKKLLLREVAITTLLSVIESLQGVGQFIHVPKVNPIALILFDSSGIALYSKSFKEEIVDEQLISGFISAIMSLGSQLFGTGEISIEPMVIRRKGSTIVVEGVDENTLLAFLVCH